MILFALLWAYTFRKTNWLILPGVSLLFFGIYLAMVKTDVKNVFLFLICVIYLLSASWVFVFKTESCLLRSEFLNDLGYGYKLHVVTFVIPLNVFRVRREFLLSLQALGLVQTTISMSSHSIRFSFWIFNLNCKV